MNGFELCEKILELDVNIRICFMTAFVVNIRALREVYTNVSFGCFIEKPVSIKHDISNVVYGQADLDQTNSNSTNSLNLQDIPVKKVHVGDIDVDYKMFGNREPLLVLNGAGQTMNDWPSSLLKVLSSNHTVIMFDARGIGNTTGGSNPYTFQQLADDTAGLLDALKIPKANVMGHSLGSWLAQAFTISYPEKVNSVTLISSSCGGKDGIPKPPEFRKLQDDFVNKSLHNIPVTEEIKAMMIASYGSEWVKLHPEVLDIPANFTLQQATPGVPPETAEK